MAGGGGQSAARTEAAGPVVICCAADDQSAIDVVARELQQAGHSVEIVSGADADPKQLADAIDHCHGEGLYVLCRSRALGRDAVDALREILLAKHVPFGRTLTVASTRQRELRDRIVASLKRVAAGRVRRMSSIPPEGRRAKPASDPAGAPPPEPSPARTSGSARKERKTQAAVTAPPRKKPTRLGLPVQTPQSKPKPAVQPDARAESDAPRAKKRRRPTQLGMMIPVPKPVPVTQSRPLSQRGGSPPPIPTEPPAEVLPTDVLPVTEDEPATLPNDPVTATHSDTVSLPKTTTPDAEPSDSFDDDIVTNTQMTSPDGPAPAHLESDGPRAAEESVARAAPIAPEELADLDRTDPKRKLEGLVTGGGFEDIPIRSGNTSVSRALVPPPPPPVRSGDTVVVQEGMIAGKELDFSSIPESYVTAGPPLPAGRSLGDTGLPPASRSSHLADPPAAGLGLDPESGADRARPKWVLPAALGVAAVLGAIAVAVVVGGDDEDDASGEIASAEIPTVPKDPKNAESSDDGAASEGGDEAVPVADQRTLVGEALKRRTILALDVLLISADSTDAIPFDDAVAHCEGLDLDGVGGWRLPEMGELMSLREADMIGRGYYWSSTPADTFGDQHLVFYGRRERVVTRSQDNFAICVRQTGE